MSSMPPAWGSQHHITKRGEVVAEWRSLQYDNCALSPDGSTGTLIVLNYRIDRVLRWLVAQQPTRTESAPINVFSSVADADRAHLTDLNNHMAILSRNHIIKHWYRQMVPAGYDREVEVARYLGDAQLVLVLVSADLCGSEVHHNELEHALRLHQRGLARVIRIMVRPYSLEGSALAKVPVLPKSGRDVVSYENRDEAWAQIVSELRWILMYEVPRL